MTAPPRAPRHARDVAENSAPLYAMPFRLMSRDLVAPDAARRARMRRAAERHNTSAFTPRRR